MNEEIKKGMDEEVNAKREQVGFKIHHLEKQKEVQMDEEKKTVGFSDLKAVSAQLKDEPRNRAERRHPDLSALLKEMPPFVARNHPRFKEWTGYSGRTMANLDCLQMTDNIKKIMLGNTVAYERESLIPWLDQKSRVLSA